MWQLNCVLRTLHRKTNVVDNMTLMKIKKTTTTTNQRIEKKTTKKQKPQCITSDKD